MARKNLLIGVALAASLLTACGSGTTSATSSSTSSSTTSASSASTPSTASTPSSSSSSTVAPSSETETETSESMASDSSDTAGTITPAELDAQSTAWFTGFCDSLSKVEASSTTLQQSQSAAGTQTPQEYQATAVTAITAFGNDLKTASGEIGALTPPTIDKGPEYASAFTTGLASAGDAVLQAAQTYGAAAVTDQASLTAAGQTLTTTLQTELANIGTTVEGLETQIAPDVKAAVEQLPNCSGLS